MAAAAGRKPALKAPFTAPAGWAWDYFVCKEREGAGHKIRFGFCQAANPRGLAVFAPGRTSTSEEYFEFMRDFLGRGFSVAILDWQGQGLSYRFDGDNSRHHSNGFDDDLRDFSLFLERLDRIDEFHGLPRLLIAHSMGGHIGLRHLAARPDDFKAAVLMTPMAGIAIPSLISPFVTAIIAGAQAVGMGKSYVPGFSRWSVDSYDDVKHRLSSDLVRREIQKQWYQARPELQCGGVTFDWLDQALKSIDAFKSGGRAQAVQTPTLFVLAEHESVVSNESIEAVAAAVPGARTLMLDGAHHMVFMETDAIRERLLHAIDTFLKNDFTPAPEPARLSR